MTKYLLVLLFSTGQTNINAHFDSPKQCVFLGRLTMLKESAIVHDTRCIEVLEI